MVDSDNSCPTINPGHKMAGSIFIGHEPMHYIIDGKLTRNPILEKKMPWIYNSSPTTKTEE